MISMVRSTDGIRTQTKVCTHSPVARTFSGVHTLRVHFAHMHGSIVSVVRMPSSLCHLTFSFFMFHPSLLLLFLDGHFETTPDYDLTDFDVHDFLPNLPDLKAEVKCTPHEDEEFGSLAKSVPNTNCKYMQESTRTHETMISWDKLAKGLRNTPR